eukprot:8466287-Alexandrium_andersonii.AAC.1
MGRLKTPANASTRRHLCSSSSGTVKSMATGGARATRGPAARTKVGREQRADARWGCANC